MKESYVPGIFDRSRLDECIPVDDEEAFTLVRRLALEEGLFVGMSSGAALAGALRVAQDMAEGTVVVIFPDGGDRYLSTGVFESRKRARRRQGQAGLRLYNTLTRQTELFHPRKEGRASMYTCGPTADGYLNLSLARRFIVADLLKRHMAAKGFEVNHIINITDLDDRIIMGAENAGQSPEDFTAPFIDALFKDLDCLGIKQASGYPRTTDHVNDMIELTCKLLDKGIAYEKNHSVYFDITRYRNYARFSGVNLDKIKLGATVDLDSYDKNNPKDFVLFKRATLKEVKKGIFFETPWGLCRPGWHVQCAAMSMKYLGESFDIHTSESHLHFPHNENEIAIADSATGKPLARYWLTSASVMAGGKTMFDQSDNRTTPRKLFEIGYTGRQLRFFLLRTRYRKPLVYSSRNLDDACKALHRLDVFANKVWFAAPAVQGPPIKSLVDELMHRFNNALDDDLNISAALAALFSFIKKLNPFVDGGRLDAPAIDLLRDTLHRINAVIGVFDLAGEPLNAQAKSLIRRRDRARRQGEWQEADDLWVGLLDCGFFVFDGPTGVIWERIPAESRQ